MKKWLGGAVDRLVAKATKRVTEKAAEEAAERAVRKVKDTARDALDRAEDVLFGPDDEAKDAGAERARGEPPPARRPAESQPGALQKAREEADRRARERIAADAAAEKRKQGEIDDELARMKERLGKR